MKFSCSVIAVKNIEISKKFYETVLNQKIISDFGINVTFEGDFALQQGYSEMIGIPENEVKQKSNNFEMYFEEEKFDDFLKKLKTMKEIKYVHDVKKYDWGQRVIRFYDPDEHIIEVGETMENVARRFFEDGLSIEEISEKTMLSIEFLKNCL